MSEKKVTDVMLERIKYFVNAIENGEYKPIGYTFTITLTDGNKSIAINDKNHLFQELN